MISLCGKWLTCVDNNIIRLVSGSMSPLFHDSGRYNFFVKYLLAYFLTIDCVIVFR